ncbi:hypothetical protein, partial [Mesorhizobium sp. M8A.F.Ca.ET.198.01.1.1]
YGFFVRPFFGEATPYQTQPSPWSSGGATAIAGGSIKTNNLAAISADLGDIRAGTVGSPDGKFLITLTQGKLEWFE